MALLSRAIDVLETTVQKSVPAVTCPVTGIYDDARFERHVRDQLRKPAKMPKANIEFEKTLRF